MYRTWEKLRGTQARLGPFPVFPNLSLGSGNLRCTSLCGLE